MILNSLIYLPAFEGTSRKIIYHLVDS